MPGVIADLDLALLSFDGEMFPFAALFTSANRAVTGKRRGKFELIRALPEPLPVNSILRRARLPAKSIDATGRISSTPIADDLAGKVYDWIRDTSPLDASVVDALMRLRERMMASRTDPAYLCFSEQRDGVGVLADILGLDRAAILGHAMHTRKPARSFIEMLPPSTGRTDERRIIEHDMAMFGDWKSKPPKYTATREYSDGKATATLLCVDNTDVERIAGVDLIYHIDAFDSFVMIQYKRMSGGRYRPDARCRAQVERMARAYEHMTAAPSQNASERDFRLSSNPFFFKVCEGTVPIEFNEALIEGMYFSLEHWQRVLADLGSRGPKGGVEISRKTAPRWFSNTEFIDLAKKGWIGTTRAAGIQWVKELVQQLLDDEHSLILARLVSVHSGVRPEHAQASLHFS